MNDFKSLLPLIIFLAIFLLPTLLANKYFLLLLLLSVAIYFLHNKFKNNFNKTMSQTINIDPITGAIKGTKKNSLNRFNSLLRL
jgi:hypothetical protein